jgi:hypothetical protein
MPRPLRVFLCHASQDKPAVRELYNALKAEMWIDPWLDDQKISFGQHWTTVIEDAIDASDIVLIFLSRNSVHKEGFVQRELNYAWELSLEKPRNTIYLIPFRLDDCQVPRHFISRQWGDYFGERKEDTYNKLLRSMKLRYEQKNLIETEQIIRKKKEPEITSVAKAVEQNNIMEITKKQIDESVKYREAERLEEKKRTIYQLFSL